MLDDISDSILKEHNTLEDIQLKSTQATIEAHQRQATVFQDIEEVFNAQKVMMDTIVRTNNLRLKHEFHNQIVNQLNQAVLAQQQANQSIKQTMVANATEYVRDSYLDENEDVQNATIKSALSALSGGKKEASQANKALKKKKHVQYLNEKKKPRILL